MYRVPPGLVLTDLRLELRSRTLWSDVYQPVKIFHVYRRHCYRDE